MGSSGSERPERTTRVREGHVPARHTACSRLLPLKTCPVFRTELLRECYARARSSFKTLDNCHLCSVFGTIFKNTLTSQNANVKVRLLLLSATWLYPRHRCKVDYCGHRRPRLMDPSGAIHTTALLERTRVRAKLSDCLCAYGRFPDPSKSLQKEDQNVTEVMIVRA